MQVNGFLHRILSYQNTVVYSDRLSLSHGSFDVSTPACPFIRLLIRPCVQKSVPSMELTLNRDIDELIRRLEECRTRLIEQLRSRMQIRGRQLREHSVHIGTRLSATTSLLHFGVELLKESDPAAFIQVSYYFHFVEFIWILPIGLDMHAFTCARG